MSAFLQAAIRVGREGACPAIAPYLTAGDGGFERSLAVMHAIEKAGAVCLELGLPFSDPLADGPILQAAAQRSLAEGMTPVRTLELIRTYREEGGLMAVLLFSYINPLLVGLGGLGASAERLAEAGGDGFVVPDLPPELAQELQDPCAELDLGTVFFATPRSSPARIRAAAEASTGFLYCVGRTGVTGQRTCFDAEVLGWLDQVRALAGSTPLTVGFGVAEPADISALAGHTDLAISGSALVQLLHRTGGSPQDGAQAAHDFVAALCRAQPK
ncbi:MAG TPA: tryptophan synthase subunit alpha [Planctomycetes bacterium]|nr:tryptophan synthase subunit alpha [Planctomycetota bacterium]HIL37386.1 tryptophan synthase subunit alpha [Planctomycetota bacterium]